MRKIARFSVVAVAIVSTLGACNRRDIVSTSSLTTTSFSTTSISSSQSIPTSTAPISDSTNTRIIPTRPTVTTSATSSATSSSSSSSSTSTSVDPSDYYASISDSLTGNNLLEALRKLNNTKKTFTPGYNSLWSYFDKTDYDPNNKSNYIAYYRGTSATKGQMNKEHVWPNSHGGNKVEGDLHMTRPTLEKDNNGRGNSFYVEGKSSSTDGWDPYKAGMEEYYRGDCARIIFYCVVANSQLTLSSKEKISNGETGYANSMGKLEHLLKWNLSYSINIFEANRNNGAEEVQGNRNPFIDHPEYACRIWGNTNSETKQICGLN